MSPSDQGHGPESCGCQLLAQSSLSGGLGCPPLKEVHVAQPRLCWELGSLGCPPVKMQGHILKHKTFDLRVGLHQGLCSSDPLPSPSGKPAWALALLWGRATVSQRTWVSSRVIRDQGESSGVEAACTLLLQESLFSSVFLFSLWAESFLGTAPSLGS